MKQSVPLLFLVLLSACGGKDSFPELPYWQASSEAEALRMIQNSKINCGKKTCKKQVGLVGTIFIGEDKFGERLIQASQCTGFVVGKNVVATNSHCVPDSVKEKHTPCSERMNIHLPELGRFSCQEILYASPLADELYGQPDLAFFTVDRNFPVAALERAQGALPNKMKLRMQSFDPVPEEAVSGTFKEKICEVATRTGMAPAFEVGGEQSLVTYAGCNSIGGNSGSPLLDARGRVRAIHFGRYTWFHDERVAPLRVGTGLACLKWGDWSAPLENQKTGCLDQRLLSMQEYKESKTFEKFRDENIARKSEEILHGLLAELRPTLLDSFAWKVELLNSGTTDPFVDFEEDYVSRVSPLCVKAGLSAPEVASSRVMLKNLRIKLNQRFQPYTEENAYALDLELQSRSLHSEELRAAGEAKWVLDVKREHSGEESIDFSLALGVCAAAE